MSAAEYIASGLLEAYALGATSPAEEQEVERMAAQYPEVREALDLIQKDIEAYATLHAVQPAEGLREKILNSISTAKTTSTTPPREEKIEKGKIVSIQQPASRLKYFAAAASVILVVSVGINITMWKNVGSLTAEKQKLDSEMVLQRMQQTLLAHEITAANSRLDSLVSNLNFLRNPMTQNIALNSMIDGHPMKAVVHWDMNTKKVAVDPMTLPANAAGEKYVLWAIVDGQTVNEGDFYMGTNSGLMMMKEVPEASAFAISVEKDVTVQKPAGPVYVMGTASPSQP